MRRVLVDPWITRIGGWSPERTYHTEGWNLGQAPWWVGGDPGDWPDLVVMPHVVISRAQIMKPQLKTRDTEGQWSFLCSSVNTLMCCYGYVPWFHRVQKLCVSSQTVPHLPCVFISLILIWMLYNKTNYKGFPGGSDGKSVCLQCGRPGVPSLGREDPLEKEMAPHSSSLAWKIPWTEEPGGLQSMGSQRVGHNWATSPSPSNSFSPWGRRVLQFEKRLRSTI